MKGIHFNCDERIAPGNKCKSSQAFLVEPVESDHESEDSRRGEGGIDEAEFSMHAITGESGPRLMKLVPWIRN